MQIRAAKNINYVQTAWVSTVPYLEFYSIPFTSTSILKKLKKI